MANSLDSKKIFILVSSLVTGGAEVVVRTIANGLSTSRFDIHILCLYKPGRIGRELIDSGFNVTSGISSCKFDPCTFFRLFNIFSKNKDAVLLSLDHHNAIFWGAIAAKAAGLKNRILSVHSTFLGGIGCSNKQGSKNRILSVHSTRFLVSKKTFKFTDRLVMPLYKNVVALSKMHARYLAEKEKVDKRQLAIINNGVNANKFYPSDSEESRRKSKRKLSIPEGNTTVTIVAALRPEKNHDMFLDAALLVAEKRKNITFLIVGEGEEKARLQTVVNKNLLEDRVIFMGNRNDIPEILSATDISVLSSVWEIFPVTVLEAMAAGLPVISTDVGSLSEIIRNDEEGILIPPEDSAALAKAIERLADNKEIRLDMGKRARKKVLEKFSTERMLSQYVKLFEKTLDLAPD